MTPFQEDYNRIRHFKPDKFYFSVSYVTIEKNLVLVNGLYVVSESGSF